MSSVRNRVRAGFTLIELILVCTIVIIVSSLILIDNNRFGGAIALENLAYDVALTMRQAQIYGIAVQRSTASTFDTGYGMHFDMSSPATYELFSDTAGTGVYNSSVRPGEIVQTAAMRQGFSIKSLCVTPASGTEDCSRSTLDIVFVHPEPDAYITSNGVADLNNGHAIPGVLQSRARIVLLDPKGDTRSVVVYAAGQISVQ